MKHIILISHGNLASAMHGTVQLILGERPDILAIDMYLDDLPLVLKIAKLKEEKNLDLNEAIIITDILGGSVNQEILKHIDLHKTILIAGMNLALVLTIATNDLAKFTLEDAENILKSPEDLMVLVNKHIENMDDMEL